MAHPDRPPIPPPPPAMLACDVQRMRSNLERAISDTAEIARSCHAGADVAAGSGYTGATINAELAFALYREACLRGLHHTSVEAQAIADVWRFVNASDFVSLDDEAAAERMRIAGALIRRGSRIMVSIDADGAPTRCTVVRLERAAGVAERLDGHGSSVPFRLDRFLVSWWLDRPDAVHVRLHVGDPARKPAPPSRKPAPPSRKPAPAPARKATAKRRGKVR